MDSRIPWHTIYDQNIDEIIGQEHLLGPDTAFRRTVDGQKPQRNLLRPAGCGKTTRPHY